MASSTGAPSNRYQALIERIFFGKNFGNYKKGITRIEFDRDAFERAADELKVARPKNIGDIVYSMRYRAPMPESVIQTQPEGMEWIIEGAGKSKYVIRLARQNRILPRPDLRAIKVPDSTPEIIRGYALNDEQALLAIVRYNRLIDIFLGLATYSLQNHLRTTLENGTQIEIDELYIGIDSRGGHYIIPVQAKGGNDKISVVQMRQDAQWCRERFLDAVCRSICAQFMTDDRIAVFELALDGDSVDVVQERHYRLVLNAEISSEEKREYLR